MWCVWSRTKVEINIKVRALIERHAAIDWRHPPHDPERVKAAFERYLKVLNLTRTVRWIADPADAWAAIVDGWKPTSLGEARLRVGLAAHIAGWVWIPREQRAAWTAWEMAVTTRAAAVNAMFRTAASGDTTHHRGLQRIAFVAETDALFVGRVIGWLNVDKLRVDRYLPRLAFTVGSKLRSTKARRLIEIFEPMIDAFEGGAFGHILGEKEVLVLACPSLHTRGGVLHREGGPAIEWPWTKLWYWKGINVPRRVIERPETLTADEIREEQNAEIRRVMIERFGPGRYVREMGGQKISRDATGTLWHCSIEDVDGDRYVFAVVEVVNGSKEPDGTRKRYFLSVPQSCRSAIEAVAWTYGMSVKQYRQLKLRT
jgi:hypothetical protein